MADPTTYADRYEIVREIARGGMANVYLARDTKLDRPVALKVLSAELSRDPAFVERFRLEAQAAASLNEPTIVSVYDWGQEQETSFIVMEYIEGRTLREVIDHGVVTSDQAAQIGADIAKALTAAHRAGVVHRDIKPGNVIITESGQVKVADFGIARANGTGEGLTRTGAVMGTATYFSPEQAQGLPVDARSDLYSLGVVLYEMVTGVVPFTGDNAVSVAYLHVREPVRAPSQRQPDLPPALEQIILTCLAKDPNERYQTSDELRADLLRFRRGAAIVGGPATAMVAVVGDETAAVAKTSVNPAVVATGAGTGGSNKPRGPVIMVIAFLVALIAVVGFLLVQVFRDNGNSGKTVAVKNVVSLTEAKARRTLEAQGFKVTVRREPNQKPIGTVFDQDPSEGEFRETGTTVTIFVSDGAGTVRVPKVAGQDQLTATARLEKLGFVVTPIPEESETVKVGVVIRTNPKAGDKVDPGTNVEVFVSAGPKPTAVPDVSGLDQVDATQQLVALGFRVAKTTESSTSVDAGRVIRTQPGAGEPAAKDSTVTIVVSSGPKQSAVPNVVGMSQSQAVNSLSSAGFKVNVSQVVTTPANVGKVITQSPDSGTQANEGSTVAITVGIPTPTTSSSSSTTSTT
ncbi:MAG: Stk1 family PASTA domain-containing Ser/Thr kinase [Acidimicrobiia bacterium]|nr:Stk1 family PASTA domain-containing Ser/Thr kinase [Acidimicrobiia bacterium]